MCITTLRPELQGCPLLTKLKMLEIVVRPLSVGFCQRLLYYRQCHLIHPPHLNSIIYIPKITAILCLSKLNQYHDNCYKYAINMLSCLITFYYSQGFSVTWIRTLGLMGMYFIFIDSFRRNLPHLFSSPILGPFLLSGQYDC